MHVDCLSLMKIYSTHELFFSSCRFSSITGTYKYNIQRHAFMVNSPGHIGNVIYPCAYDPGFNTRLGAQCRIPLSDRFVVDCVICRCIVVCVCVWFQAFSFLCTFVPRSEKTIERTFTPWNICSLELSLLWDFRSSGANVPRTFVTMKLSYHENEYFKNFRSKCPKTRAINLTIAYAH